MEEAKAAALYEDLTRRGEGAARFKQGLGFSTANSDSDDVPARGSALAYTSSSSFMSKFVKASSPSKKSGLEKHAQIQSIQNKLKRKKSEEVSDEEENRRRRRDRDSDSRWRSRSREINPWRRSRSRDRDRDRDRDGERRRRRSRSPRRSDRRRSRSLSPARERGLEKSRGKSEKERSGGHDYRKLVQGYDKMSAAERVKAKTKLQLAETAEKDTTKGKDGWERFDFDKYAPLDDEEVEVAEDDAALVNHIGKSFRFSAFENKREERIKAAHDEAMFGASDIQPSVVSNSELEVENDSKDRKESEPPSLLSEKVLAKKQGSWRDRIHNKN